MAFEEDNEKDLDLDLDLDDLEDLGLSSINEEESIIPLEEDDVIHNEENDKSSNIHNEEEEDNNEIIHSVSQTQSNTNSALTTGKKLKILIGNGKAGLGKSTVAAQLIAPFLFMMNNNTPINLYTMESAQDNNLFNTFILNAINVEVKENSFNNTMINLYSKDEHAIFDIGGGKTTSIVLETLKNTGLIDGIDLFVIPITDGQHEALKAKEFYDFVKECNPDAKFVFALNKVSKNTYYDDVCLQFIDFLGDRNLMVDATRGVIEDISSEDRNLIHLQDDDTIKYSVREQRTVFEFAFTDMTDTENLLKKAINNNDINNIRFLSARKNNIEKAKQFYSNCIDPSILKLKSLLNIG